MNNSRDEIALSVEIDRTDGDRISKTDHSTHDSGLCKGEADVFKIKALEIFDKLTVKVVAHLEEIRATYQKEREEQTKRHRELFQNYEKLWRQMLQWFQQNRNIRTRQGIPLQAQVYPIRRSQLGANVFVRPARFNNLPRDAEEEQTEDVEEADEPDAEEDPEEDAEAEENDEEAEDAEATVEEEVAEYVLEYTPVTSAMELPSVIGRTEECKRKASLQLEDDNPKKRRLSLVECPVCQEALPDLSRAGKLLMAPTCGHVLCSNCAMRIWIQHQKRCPKCNTKYDIKTLIPVYL